MAGASVVVGENGCSVPICSWLIIDLRFRKKFESPDMLC